MNSKGFDLNAHEEILEASKGIKFCRGGVDIFSVTETYFWLGQKPWKILCDLRSHK